MKHQVHFSAAWPFCNWKSFLPNGAQGLGLKYIQRRMYCELATHERA